MATAQPPTPTGPPPTAESCLRRAAALLEDAEKRNTSPAEASLKVTIAGGWRELGMAAGYLESTRNA